MPPDSFSLEGRPIRKVRQSVTRLAKAGYRVEIVSPDAVEEPLRDELRSVSEEWRGRWPERGFTMAMDALFAYPDTRLAIAIGPDGRVGGFSSSSRLPRAAATRSPRCAAAARRRTA